ncbi:MAG TPA: hypothetical protein VJ770_10425, partial [Stellaceae bacterium]|nr:hypothetical protein [Stellaceae bacterium]
MSEGSPPRREPGSSTDPASPPAEPELGTALRLLAAALAALLHRVARRANILLRAGLHYAAARLRAGSRHAAARLHPALARSSSAALRF